MIQDAYAVTYIPCRVCGSDRPKLLGIRGNLEYSGAAPLGPGEPHMMTNVVRCRRCGFIYTNPMILLAAGDARRRYHDAEAYAPYAKDPSRELQERLTILERLARRKGRLLDVGAGKGEFLAIARQRGWHVEGVEPSEDLVRHARQQHQLTLRHGSLEQAAFPEEHFDAVTLHMVLEHVDDPTALLRAINRVLVSNGILFIEVPNLDSLLLKGVRLYFRLRQRDWSPLLSPLHWPYHCYGYGLKTLHILCRNHGFRIIKAKTVDLGRRGFRDNPNTQPWERQLREAMMRVGGLVGRGDVLMVWCRKTYR
ncbi:MAG: class I SAM-dependent methyltransferase [Candidatus Omnitrophota bacterium]|nr:class I SAM-dependent methyltransferase [Candidatus Omnitrophota bacterium]